jgi:HD-like signal output (HDOD) protein
MVLLALPDCEEPDRLLAALQAAEIMGALQVVEILLYHRDKWSLPRDLVEALEETYTMLQEQLRILVWPYNTATMYLHSLATKKIKEKPKTSTTSKQ